MDASSKTVKVLYICINESYSCTETRELQMLFLLTFSVVFGAEKMQDKNLTFLFTKLLYTKLQKRPPLNSQMDSIRSQVFV